MRTIPGISEIYSKKIISIFSHLPRQTEVILFGSRAKGNFREGSDIDIALKNTSVSLEQRHELLNSYENLFLPWKLDLVTYESIQEPALKEHIDRVGLKLFI